MKCEECKYWEKDDEGGWGDCRRFPPNSNGWPRLGGDFWCGEFEAKEEPAMPSIRETLDRVYEAGGKVWDDIDETEIS